MTTAVASLDRAGPIVRVRDAFVAFQGAGGRVMALRGADLTVSAGERLLVQGPNGSGKSTLLRVITGEQPVVAGSVLVSGRELHRLGPSARRRWRAAAVGFVDQHAGGNLLPELSVIDNVSVQLRLSGTGRSLARRTALNTLTSLGLAGLADRDVSGLSGGEAQRVAICAAVAHHPALLLADEPTGELDEDSARQVYAVISSIAAGGTSVVMVSHDPRASVFADRGIRVRDGRIAEQWTPGRPDVAQVPDSRGWIRVPPELVPGGVVPELIARPAADGVRMVLTDRPSAVVRTDADDLGRPSAMDTATGSEIAVLPVDTAADPTIAFTGVTAGFAGRTLLRDLTFALRPGQWTVVTGPSGSGKSTLLSIAAGLVDPLAGTVAVGGRSWAGQRRPDRARHRAGWLSMVPQRPALVQALTVRENLALTGSVRGAPQDPAEIEHWLSLLGLAALADQQVHRLSGGERQRTAVARTVVSGAPALVLDEPTSQQDEASAARVIRVLHAAADRGAVILAASHDPRFNQMATSTMHLG